MMDASLSMAGENLAIAAVAAAVLALKMRSEDLSVVVFENVARAISHLEERDDPEQIVRPTPGRAGARLHQHRGRACAWAGARSGAAATRARPAC